MLFGSSSQRLLRHESPDTDTLIPSLAHGSSQSHCMEGNIGSDACMHVM